MSTRFRVLKNKKVVEDNLTKASREAKESGEAK